MEIVNPLSPSGAKEDIKTVLYALAGQGGRDGEPYDQMQEAGDYIATLEAELERWEQSRDGVLLQLEEIECRNMTLEAENAALKDGSEYTRLQDRIQRLVEANMALTRMKGR